MNLAFSKVRSTPGDFPRASGDEPSGVLELNPPDGFSPREWG